MTSDDAPSAWVTRFAHLVVHGGDVLDVAAGRGRHARWLEARGHRVTAVDRDADALARSGASEAVVHDLELGDPAATWPFGDRRFDAVVVVRYLHRPLFPRLVDALAPGGVLLYETFAVGQARFGRPTRPAFLLEPGELLDRCRALVVVAYEDGIDGTEGPDGTTRPASVQRICAVAPRAGDGLDAGVVPRSPLSSPVVTGTGSGESQIR